VPVIIYESLMTGPWFRRLCHCHANSPQHRETPTEGSSFAAVDNARITFQEPSHDRFIHLVQVELPIAEPFAEFSDCVHLHWRG
jgi:hypothetical protein